MVLTSYILEALAQKAKTTIDKISVLHLKMDCANGACFWVVVDGETSIKQIRLGWLK